MSWDFSTEPEFQAQLDWIEEFVSEEIEPLDLVFSGRAFHLLDAGPLREIVDPLKQRVRDRGLWACHLGPELGGQGYGQVKLSLMNEILGRSQWAPIVFGTQAPDTGNAEIIAHYGTDEQKARYLQPLLDGEIFSCYSMTEPQGGSDPALFETVARRDGDDWVINGWKFFSSNARTSAFLIVMAITDTETDVYRGMSMFLVPTDTPGVDIVRNIGLMGEGADDGMHALIHYDDVRVPADSLLGGEGQAFVIAQTRLGGAASTTPCAPSAWPNGRSTCSANGPSPPDPRRGAGRQTKCAGLRGRLLHRTDPVPPLCALRRLEHRPGGDYRAVRHDIAAIKVLTPKMIHDVAQRAIQVHGALGVSNEMPLGAIWMAARSWAWSTARPRCTADGRTPDA